MLNVQWPKLHQEDERTTGEISRRRDLDKELICCRRYLASASILRTA